MTLIASDNTQVYTGTSFSQALQAAIVSPVHPFHRKGRGANLKMLLGRRGEIQFSALKKSAKILSWLALLYNNARLKWKLIGIRVRLIDLPDELLFCIADYLETERDVNALLRVNRRLYCLLCTYLYRRNVQHSNSSALIWAAEKGKVSVARRLLEQRANIEVKIGHIHCYPRSHTHLTPLWLATWWGHIEMVKLLLEIPDIGLEPRDHEQGKTPLHMAAVKGHEEIVSLLISQPGIHLDRKTFKGKTPLLFAAKHGHVEIVRRLLATGRVDINARASGLTPLLGAIYRRHEQVVEALLQNENINPNLPGSGPRWTSTPLMASLGRTSIVKRLLEKNVDVNFRPMNTSSTVLIHAVMCNMVDVVKMLLDHGADVNISVPHNDAALVVACSRAGSEMVELLLDAGADVNARGRLYGNALQTVSCNSESVAKLLLSRGADVNAKGGLYGSALHAASYAGYEELVKMLLAKGAEVNVKNREGSTALHTAATSGHALIVKLLLENGADVSAQSERWGNVLAAAHSGQRVYSERDHERTIRLLLEAGADNTPQAPSS